MTFDLHPPKDKLWTDDKTRDLNLLWGAGYSASIVADRLGDGFTRNCVLGKLHRLGKLKAREVPVRYDEDATTKRNRPTYAPRPPRPAPGMPAIRGNIAPKVRAFLPPPPEPSADGHVTFDNLARGMCKWPIGDPSHRDFKFCGHEQRGDGASPYCEYHARLAYAKPRPVTRSPFVQFRKAGGNRG